MKAAKPAWGKDQEHDESCSYGGIMTQRISIDPITRLEGHGKIEIFLDDQGNVANTYFQIPELRGFERFVVGRPIEEMALITNRISASARKHTTWQPPKLRTPPIKLILRARPRCCVSCCTPRSIAPTTPPTSMHWAVLISSWGPHGAGC